MTVHVQQSFAAIGFFHHMPVPQFVEEGLRVMHLKQLQNPQIV